MLGGLKQGTAYNKVQRRGAWPGKAFFVKLFQQIQLFGNISFQGKLSEMLRANKFYL